MSMQQAAVALASTSLRDEKGWVRKTGGKPLCDYGQGCRDAADCFNWKHNDNTLLILSGKIDNSQLKKQILMAFKKTTEVNVPNRKQVEAALDWNQLWC